MTNILPVAHDSLQIFSQRKGGEAAHASYMLCGHSVSAAYSANRPGDET